MEEGGHLDEVRRFGRCVAGAGEGEEVFNERGEAVDFGEEFGGESAAVPDVIGDVELEADAREGAAAPPPSTGMAAAITLAAIILIAGFIALGTGS